MREVAARPSLRVGIVGCGLIGYKRADALGEGDAVIGAVDPVAERAAGLVRSHGGRACADLDELLALSPDGVAMSTTPAVARRHGEYVGRIHDEARQRPKFIVESRNGFDDAQ